MAIVTRVAGHRHAALLLRMFVLAVTSALGHLPPTIRFDRLMMSRTFIDYSVRDSPKAREERFKITRFNEAAIN